LLIRKLTLTNPQLLRDASGPSCSEKQVGEGGRNARAASRAMRVFWKFSPRQFAFENYRLPLALPQSSSKIRNDHVSLNSL
jgi:hypothetical protein